MAVPAKAPPPVVINNPHALAVCGGLRGRGSGGQRQSRGGPGGGGRGQQQGGRGQQQQWSQRWNEQLPSHVGGQMRQQPSQQQYVHRQQQQQQPYQQQYVRQQQQLLQPHHSSHHVSPKWGIGGPFDCGSNATGWYQEESPLPPSSPMGSVCQCKRCGGRLGYMAQIVTTPQRFEGACNSCGQYGHRHHNCITNKYNTHAHANVINYPSGFNWGGQRKYAVIPATTAASHGERHYAMATATSLRAAASAVTHQLRQ